VSDPTGDYAIMRQAEVEPMDPTDNTSLPYVRIGGAYVWVTVENGRLAVSVGTEESQLSHEYPQIIVDGEQWHPADAWVRGAGA
jgi:hypothetical protein